MEQHSGDEHLIPVEQGIHRMHALLRPIIRRYGKLYWAKSLSWLAARLREQADARGMVRFNQVISLLLQATDPARKPNINRGMDAVHNMFRSLERLPSHRINPMQKSKSKLKQPLTVAEAIAKLRVLDPAAYLCLDNDGVLLEVIDLLDGFRGPIHPSGESNDVIYLELRGDAERHEQLLAAMQSHLNAKPILQGPS